MAQSMRMPNYKLTSFKGRGRAEVAREMLFLGNVPYQEQRVAMDHWPSLRPGTPSGNVPELEANGKKLTQPFAIYRYLAQELGFNGSSPFEAAQIDSLAELHREYEEEIDSLMAVLFGFSEGNREEMVKAIGEPARDKYFPMLEDIAKKSGSTGHFIGTKLTWVDLLIAEHVSIMEHQIPGFLAYYPHVLKTTKKILDTPRLREWAKKRAESTY